MRRLFAFVVASGFMFLLIALFCQQESHVTVAAACLHEGAEWPRATSAPTGVPLPPVFWHQPPPAEPVPVVFAFVIGGVSVGSMVPQPSECPAWLQVSLRQARVFNAYTVLLEYGAACAAFCHRYDIVHVHVPAAHLRFALASLGMDISDKVPHPLRDVVVASFVRFLMVEYFTMAAGLWDVGAPGLSVSALDGRFIDAAAVRAMLAALPAPSLPSLPRFRTLVFPDSDTMVWIEVARVARYFADRGSALAYCTYEPGANNVFTVASLEALRDLVQYLLVAVATLGPGHWKTDMHFLGQYARHLVPPQEWECWANAGTAPSAMLPRGACGWGSDFPDMKGKPWPPHTPRFVPENTCDEFMADVFVSESINLDRPGRFDKCPRSLYTKQVTWIGGLPHMRLLTHRRHHRVIAAHFQGEQKVFMTHFFRNYTAVPAAVYGALPTCACERETCVNCQEALAYEPLLSAGFAFP
jgi:hypothetical protein